jgi:hypothetical protein
MHRLILAFLLTLALFAAAPAAGAAQQSTPAAQTPWDEGRRSMPARLVQRVGPTEITIVYNRPVARGRVLFGALVPWDSVWNPGADEATRIELSNDILIEGQRLPAGRYSIWAIPRRDEWTLIFHPSWDVQHRPLPPGNEALRLRVPSRSGTHMESLAFYFPVADTDGAELVLHWGETVVPLRIRHP